ncbi:helix-turn-helix transcriptional regulator [Streptomyces hoynatensis]|uniref:Helix-turn-helix transcriptional regulator n=2 Tax=Streptomyces hoynatensis TaxID=1141874 RepID=A0A3A9YZT8_9ACTN|nr:helix-turn-helix transcriptional regulator [Streptomyces hoynatensis]
MLLFDRDNELDILAELLSESLGGSGRIAVICGATGLGKTALIKAFVEDAASRSGAVVLSAAASRAERTLPLGVVSQLLHGADGIPPGTAERIARQLDHEVRSAGAPDAAPGLADHVTAPLLHGLCNDLLGLAQEAPLIVVVDDAQHTDALSLRCLAQLMRRSSAARILALFTQSTELDQSHAVLQAEILHRPGCRYLRLAPLSRAGVHEMLSRTLGLPRDHGLAEAYHQLSGGNPLLLQALVDDHRLGARPGAAGPVTGQVYEQAVLACLYRCGADVLRVAQALAVLGEDATPALLELCAKPGSGSADQAIRILGTTGLLAGEGFRDPAIREAVLTGMPRHERSQLQSRVAEALYGAGAPAGVVAGHLVDCEAPQGPWVVGVLREAAEAALAEGDPTFAIRCLRLAHAECSDEQERVELMSMMTSAQWQLNPLSIGSHLPQLTDAIREGHLVGPRAITPVNYLLWHGRLDEATEALTHLRENASATEADADIESALDVQLTRLSLPFTYPELARRLEGTRRAGPSPLPEGKADPLHPAAAALDAILNHRPHDDTPAAKAQRVLEGVPLDNVSLAPLLSALVTLLHLDRLDDAAAWCDSFIKEAGVRATPTWHALFCALRGQISLHQGDLRAAAGHASTALTIIPPKGWGVVIGVPLSCLVMTATGMGRHEEAAEHLKVPVPEALFHTTLGLLYLRARGRHHLALGRRQAARADFQACGRLMSRWELDRPVLIPWRTELAHCHLEQNEVAEARRLALEQLGLLGDAPSRIRGITLRTLAAASPPRERLGLLREAAEALQHAGDQWELAQVLAEQSRTLAALSEHAQARVVARRAHRLAQACGAEPLLRALNGQAAEGPQPAAAEELAELSDAERRVASLAAQGHTNRQIATKLFITVSTVEQHLTHVYRKLNVKRRTDLPLSLHAE